MATPVADVSTRGEVTMRSTTRDRGQVGLLVLIVSAVLFVALSTATAELGARMIERTQARTAADAAALGAVVGGPEVARTIAHRHGATVVAITHDRGVDEVTVVVRVGTATASAAATAAP
jgi:hypothetical protein